VNQCLIQDAIENNPITTIFQNDERPRSGKFNVPLYPDTMIKILIKTQRHLEKVKLKLKIIPVCINFDRVFDVDWFAEEVLKGKVTPDTTMIDVIGKAMNMRKGKLGKVFLKYADPIDLEDYIADYKAKHPRPQPVSLLANSRAISNPPFDFEKLSMRLTRDLYVIQ